MRVQELALHGLINRVRHQDLQFAEMVAAKEVYDAVIEGTERPLVIFNGELDRIRSGYYPPFFYPGLAKMAKEWLPKFCTAFYIHNFKGRNPGEHVPLRLALPL